MSFDAGPSGAIMVNNDDWLSELQYIPFLRDVGRHFTINRMLTMDSVQLRLEREQPLTFLEFNYMILQGYDFVELFKRYGCTLQMGGSDQWGNIVQGVELGRRMARRAVVRSDLAADHDLFRRQDGQDRQRRRLARIQAVFRPTTTGNSGATPRMATSGGSCACSRICRSMKSRRLEQLKDAEINVAKEILATEATRLCHGDKAPLMRRRRLRAPLRVVRLKGCPPFT